MTDTMRRVLDVYPTASCTYNMDDYKFTVYHLVDGCRVALSGSWQTQSMAWHDAMRRVDNVYELREGS